MKKTLIATAMMLLLGPGAFAAQPSASKESAAPATLASTTSSEAPAKPAGARMYNLNGKIFSLNDRALVVQTRRGKKATDHTFMLNTDTKREGSLNIGEMVKVEYWTHGKENIATLVQVQPLKTTAQSKPPKSRY